MVAQGGLAAEGGTERESPNLVAYGGMTAEGGSEEGPEIGLLRLVTEGGPVVETGLLSLEDSDRRRARDRTLEPGRPSDRRRASDRALEPGSRRLSGRGRARLKPGSKGKERERVFQTLHQREGD